MSDHATIALITVAGFTIQLGMLGIIIWMVRDFHKASLRHAEHVNGLLAATFLHGRQIKDVVEEARRLLREGP